MTMDNSASRQTAYEMTLASVQFSSRPLGFNRSAPTRTESSKQAAQDNNIEVKASLQPTPIPPSTKPSLFLPKNSNAERLLSKFLKTSQNLSAKSTKWTGYIPKSVCLWHHSNWWTESQGSRRHHITPNKTTKRRYLWGWSNLQQKVQWSAKILTVNSHKYDCWHQTIKHKHSKYKMKSWKCFRI